jgi:GalNAc-alpha-(1->4)-GalNAc-alpha-(1->3)-diNAcBac-PP-undecaprenol alpha-1,4-N-acetyl-D-galactosaminyltransferase
MRIAFILNELSYGGGERVILCLSERFGELGHEIVFYTWNKQLVQHGQDRLSFAKHIYTLGHQGLAVWGKVLSVQELREHLVGDGIDVLVSFCLSSSEISTVAGLLAHVPVVISERIDPGSFPIKMIHKLFRPVFYGLAAGKVFQTRRVLEYFPSFVRKNAIVIPNPVIDRDLPPPMLDPTLKRKEIVAAGRLSAEKNFSMLIRSFRNVKPKHPEYRLIIYGEGELREDLERQIKDLELQDSVALYGNVPRVVDHINGAEIFVLASDHEGMPNALIEAMAMGLACISTNFPSGGAEALIHHMTNGILVPVGNESALTHAMVMLIENRLLRESISRSAVEVRASNDLRSIGDNWIAYLQSLSVK